MRAMAAPKRPIRIAPVERKSGPPIWVKILGGGVLLLVGAHFYLLHQINQFADGIVDTANMFANASHQGGYYTWDGNLGIKRLRIESSTGERASLTMQALELETPGWWWLLQLANPLEGRAGRLARATSLLGDNSGTLLPATDHLHLHLRGFELDINDFLPPGLPDVGFSTGALFETEGCTNLRYFVPLQLTSDLRLPYAAANLSLGYRATGPEQAVIEFVHDVPGVSQMRLELDWKTDDPRHFLEADGEGESPTAVRLSVSDAGFVEARNRWCAQQAQVDPEEFQRRHITTVRRILEVYGLRLSPETETIYSAYAREGGSLGLQAEWPKDVSATTFAAYSPQQQWELMQPRVWRNGGIRKPLVLEFVKPRPLPAAYSGSVYDLLARNADIADANSAAPLEALGERISSLTPPTTEGSVDAKPEAEVAQPAPSRPSRPAEPQPTPIDLATENLIAAIGERVAIETDDGRSRIGTLVAVEPKTLTIRMAVSGGKADLSFSRERIRAVIANPARR
jgi:hypothetical protein